MHCIQNSSVLKRSARTSFSITYMKDRYMQQLFLSGFENTTHRLQSFLRQRVAYSRHQQDAMLLARLGLVLLVILVT